MRTILESAFFRRAGVRVGRELLGKYIVRATRGVEVALPITEVEVYDGPHDRASHAFRGKTERNQIMWSDAGRLYIYFVYGMHWLLNVVVGKKDYPAAILIRGADGSAGPARLTARLKITGEYNGKMATPANGIWFEDRGVHIRRGGYQRLPRIGVAYAGAEWANKKLRFVLKKERK
jgi:DNA-3-methyladenine glycosylase